MPPYEPQELDQNLLGNLIRQKRLQESFGNAQLPDKMPEQSPDVHIAHTIHLGGLPQASLPQDQQSPQSRLDPVQSQAVNVPKVGQIDPNSPNAAQSQYKQAVMQEPMHSDYHPSKLRNVLSTIAGMSVGAFQGPKMGSEVLSGLKDAPFIDRHRDWEQSAEKYKTLAGIDAGNIKEKLAADKEAALAEEARSHGGLYKQQTKVIPNTPQEDQDKQVAIREASLAHSQGTIHEAKLKDGRIVTLLQDNKGNFKNPETNEIVKRDAIDEVSDAGKSLKETKEQKMPAALLASVQARQIIADTTDKYDAATKEAAKEFIKKLEKGQEPTAAYADIVRTREKELGRALSSDEKIKLDHLLQPEQKIAPVFAPNASDPSKLDVIPVKPGSTVPANAQTSSGINAENTDTSTTRTMKEAAPHVVSFMNKLDKEIDDQVKNLGVSAGRWSDFWTGKVGAPNPGFATLRTDAMLAKTMLLKMHVGSRGGIEMYKHFSELLDLAGQDPTNLKAAVSAIRDYANEINKSKEETKALGNNSSSNSDMISAQIPGQAPGQIHRNQRDAFLKKYPNAKVGQ